MATQMTIIRQFTTRHWFKLVPVFIWSTLLAGGFIACSQGGQAEGSKRKLRVAVGEIKEVSLPGNAERSAELIGTSDNQEVVEVSRPQLAPAVDTVRRSTTEPTVFQIKGVTVGKANVVFSSKPLGSSGTGQPVRTYVVQVTAK